MASLSEEEENYVRLALLLKGVTPRAVRTYFDRECPPASLPLTLSRSHNTLLDLKAKRIINQAQWKILVPSNGVPDSKTFDVTLMICLIRNLTSINHPINGFDSLPLPGEITPGSDLARIKCYRNKLAHHDSNTIDTTYFNTAWRDISEAVSRLGGQIMFQECQELKLKILDQSYQEIMLEIKQSLEEMKELKHTVDNLGIEHSRVTENLRELQTSHNNLQISHSTLQTEHSKVMEIVKDPIPWNIKELITKQIEDWEKEDKMFVSTRASDYVMERLRANSCLTLTAPSGVGKSFIARHAALVLKKEEYNIIPVYSPTDIRTYYQPGTQTVFIIDDICGNFTANKQQIDNWNQMLPVIYTIIADKCCKIIVSCRLQVYKDDQFNILIPFKSCECNLISNKLCLNSVEKSNIAKAYLGSSLNDVDKLSQTSECFPLLCSLYDGDKNKDVKDFFKNPFKVYQNELDNLCRHGNEGILRICSLALCVIFNNQLEEKWFKGELTDEQKYIMEDICDACEINRITSKATLKKALDTLDGTFICKQNGIYRTLHDKLFDFLAHYFGKKMIECLIIHGDSGLVHERFIWQESPDDKKSNVDFIIEIPDDYLESYLERFVRDWSVGNVTGVFNNNNMKVSSFRQQLLNHLQQQDKSQQVTLANTKDTAIAKGDYGSGNTPLIDTCYEGYLDMVQWMLHNDADVDQSRDNGVTGLIAASLEGHTDIVKLLLEKNANVDICDKHGFSPVLSAIAKGHTDTVKLLLEGNPNVNQCDKNGRSSLFWASHKGYTDIVKLLLQRDPNIDQCDKHFSISPLCMACMTGHTDIVKLLLEKDPNVDLCDNDGRSPLYRASQEGHTDIVKLLLEKNPNVDLCDNKGFTPLISSCICNNISIVRLLIKHKPNIDAQTFDGGSALYFSVISGNLDITQLLLENNADCNTCGPSKQSIIDKIKNDPTKTLDKYKQNCFDSLIKNALPRVADYISKKSVDYVFDVEAGSSSLHIACFTGRIGVVRCLLDHNANINISNENGTTSLFFACELGHEDIVRLLLDNGADTQMCRLDGSSPLQIAIDNGHTSIVIRMIVTEFMKKWLKQT